MRIPVARLCALFVLVATAAIAQEKVALQPAIASTDAANTGLLAKISHQTEVITILQSQLSQCRNGQEITGTVPEAEEEFHALNSRSALKAEDTTEDEFSTAPTATVAPVAVRTVGVYQQAPEPRLTCADYSMYYFSRHPSMAAVCGVNTRTPQPAVSSSTSSGNWVSITTLLSVTTPKPSR